MFRRLLDWSEDYEPLSVEMSFIETYLMLEKFRFKDKFRYAIRIGADAGRCRIPKMIVQPIVENACRHGLQGITGMRNIYIDAELNGGILTITVEDNGKGIEKDKLAEIISGLDKDDFEGHSSLKNFSVCRP